MTSTKFKASLMAVESILERLGWKITSLYQIGVHFRHHARKIIEGREDAVAAWKELKKIIIDSNQDYSIIDKGYLNIKGVDYAVGCYVMEIKKPRNNYILILDDNWGKSHHKTGIIALKHDKKVLKLIDRISEGGMKDKIQLHE